VPGLTPEAGRGTGSTFVLNVFWNALGVAAGLASGLLLSPYLIRKLGPEGYGVWALSFALIEYYWLLDLGFRSATAKFVAHHWALDERARIREVISTALLYSSLAATLIAVSILLAAPLLENIFQVTPQYRDIFTRLIVVVSFSWCTSMVFGVFGAALEAAQRFDLASRGNIAGTIIRTCGAFVLLHLGYGLLPLGLLTLASQVVVYSVHYYGFTRIFPGKQVSLAFASVAMLRRMGSFGIHTFAVNVSQQLLSQSAPLLIGHFHSTTLVGFYTLPVRLLQYTVEMVARIGLVTNSSAAAWSALDDRESLGKLAIYSNRYCLILFLPLSIVFLTHGQGLFLKWVGPEFARYSAPLLPVLLIGQLLAIVGQFSSTMLLQGLGRHQTYARGLMVESALGIAALWFVIPRFGILGAAWVGSLFMVTNRMIFTSWLTSREIGMGFLPFLHAIYSRALAAALPAFAAAWWMKESILPGTSWAQLALAGLLTGSLYYVVALWMAVPSEHRVLLGSWIGRLSAKAGWKRA